MKAKTFFNKGKTIVGTFIIDKKGNGNLAYNEWDGTPITKIYPNSHISNGVDEIVENVRKYCEYKGYYLQKY